MRYQTKRLCHPMYLVRTRHKQRSAKMLRRERDKHTWMDVGRKKRKLQ